MGILIWGREPLYHLVGDRSHFFRGGLVGPSHPWNLIAFAKRVFRAMSQTYQSCISPCRLVRNEREHSKRRIRASVTGRLTPKEVRCVQCSFEA
jgi:hypothetical protein